MGTNFEDNPEESSAWALSRPRSRPDSLVRPNKRDQRSLSDYDQVAGKIVDLIGPETVLDVGCSFGLLVERLRRRRVEAVGIDPDDSLLEQADPQIRPFLTRSEYTGPLPGERYSLVVSIEALTGLPDETAAAAIRGICRKTDDVIFSAQAKEEERMAGEPAPPAAFWAGLFAENGFFRDLAFDATFISPWAARFRYRPDLNLLDAVREYEGRFQQLWAENTALQVQVNDQEKAFERSKIEQEIIVKTLASRVQQWESQWFDLEQSMGWKLLHGVRLLRHRLAPSGTRRASLLRILRDSVIRLQKEGLSGFFRSLREGLTSRELFVAPGVKTIEQINAETYPDFVRWTMPEPEELERQRTQSRTWDHRPLISIVTPVYKPPPEVLSAMLESVLAQTYENWELCIADASVVEPEVRRLLQEYAEKDDRIRLQFLDQNLGIAGNGNVAIGMAVGEYIAILDHDDVLAPHMLYEVVLRIRENDLADVIYFDEDKLSEDGLQRRDPFFKPDFSPEMLVSANYLTHAVYRRTLVEAVGRYDLAYEGCQDWDLAFKITEGTRQIEHIPKVLYHWRQISGSTAGEFAAKSYVFHRQLRCVEAHLRRKGLMTVRALFPIPGFLRATWGTSEGMVSIIIPTKDKADYLKRAIDSIKERTTYPEYEIIIVDNGSKSLRTRRYFDQLRRDPNIRIVDYYEMFNYSRANNLGVRIASGDFYLFLNNDVEILHADWLEEMVRWAERPEIGVVGAKLLYPDGAVQHAGVVIGMEGHASHVFWGYRDHQGGPFGSADWYRNFSAITGACMMVRREVFDEVGGFDERYVLAFSDIELCLRTIEHGYRIVYTPYARLRHYEGKSRGDHIPSNDILAGIDDFQTLVEQGDPYYNPNLSYAERKPMIRPRDEEDRVSRLLRVTSLARIDDRGS
ncbi:MAG TPA: glycosyltransferase [Anaerolineales bacterium]|nr:glycosyltransferase [Anaerolineales bacterium]